MTLHIYYHDVAGDYVEMVDAVRTGTLEVASSAEEATVQSATIRADDPTGAIDLRGHRLIWAVEDDCPDYGGVIWAGFSADRSFIRDENFIGSQRTLGINVVDANSLLDRRKMLGADCNRPAETDVARMAWLTATNEFSAIISDTTYVSSANPVHMDACDYRKQSVRDVIDDCAQQSGKNFWVRYIPASPSSDPPTFGLWYGRDSVKDEDDLPIWRTDLRISNYASDIDNVDTFAPFIDVALKRDPSRVYSGVIIDYDGGYTYVTKASTAENFAVTGRDATMSAPNVKTKTKAKARALRYLNDISTEEDVLTVTIQVGPADVNRLREGMAIEVRLQHVEEYTSWTWFRAMNRTVRNVGPELYEIAAELAPIDDPSLVTGSLYGILYKPHGPFDSPVIYYEKPGDDAPAGCWPKPTVGPITPHLSDNPPNAGAPYTGWEIGGDGEIDLYFRASVNGVRGRALGYTIIWQILKNNAVVASETLIQGSDAPDGLAYFSHDGLPVTVSGLSVANGDLITTKIICSPGMAFFRAPAGVGQGGEQLEITGGSLA